MKQALQYIEIDLPYCANTYGSAPCTAAVGVTGAIKCFNTIKTCQDRAHYVEQGATLRFAVPTDYLPASIEALPLIADIEHMPQIVSLGKDLGRRAILDVTFADTPDSDTGAGFDKYLGDRGYNPYAQGSLFRKLRARQPYLRGRRLWWYNGYVGQALADMERRGFFIEGFTGPDADGRYRITATDVLQAASGDRAQAPKLSEGFLSADITNSQTSAVLLPSGVGAKYPASGFVCIGGNEVVSFTRSGDNLTITRAQRGTVASAHKAQDRVQLCLTYDGQKAADILRDLSVTYAGESSSLIDLAAWQAEDTAFLGNVYTTTITEPTPVEDLESELIEQAALATWWDDLAQAHRFQVLRGVATDAATFTADDYRADSFTIDEQPDQLVTRVQVYFGQNDPTKPLTNSDNYRSSSTRINAQAEADAGVQAIRIIYSRWIPAAGRTVADRLGDIILGRFSPDAPRHFTFDLPRYADLMPLLASGYKIMHPLLEDATGAPDAVPIQITQLGISADTLSVGAEEIRFNAPPLSPTVDDIIIDASTFNLNLQSWHDSIYPPAVSGDTVNVTINAGVIVGSHSTATPAFDVGTWAAGVTINITVLGRIQGRGGNGGAAFAVGGAGGVALKVRRAINLLLSSGSGQVWGGGGGGGGGVNGRGPSGGGGGGAGQDAGGGGAGDGGGGSGAGGSPTAGGVGGSVGAGSSVGGAGGGPGLAGSTGGSDGTNAPKAGGAAGAAIDGVSFCTITGTGDRRGPQIN